MDRDEPLQMSNSELSVPLSLNFNKEEDEGRSR